MQTKFILHGGTKKGNTEEYEVDFFNEIFKGSRDNISVLIVPFAKDLDRQESSIQKLIQTFENFKKNKILSFFIAKEENFIEQVQLADIIYFQGGLSLRLLESLLPFSNLQENLQGKIVVGESAGANVLSQFFYTPSADEISPGLGFVPVKVIPHYIDEFEHKLDDVGKEFETLRLAEYEFKVLQTDI